MKIKIIHMIEIEKKIRSLLHQFKAIALCKVNKNMIFLALQIWYNWLKP